MFVKNIKNTTQKTQKNQALVFGGGLVLNQIQQIKTQHSIEQWKKVILDQQASGLSGRAYCHLHAIRENQFYYRIHKIRKSIITTQPIVIGTSRKLSLRHSLREFQQLSH